MDYILSHLLTVLVFLPTLGALLLLAFPDAEKGATKAAALTVGLVEFFVSLLLLPDFRPEAGYQFQQLTAWIPSLGASYHVGVDGISLFLVLLTTFLTPVAILGSWTSVTQRVREFMILLLLLETGMLGALVALDVLLFYLFWEAMLIPMYFLIGIWGYDLRVLASVKFFLYTLVGSLLMLVAILFIWNVTTFPVPPQQAVPMISPDGHTFDLVKWTEAVPTNGMVRHWQLWLFAAFALAFAIKVPMFPFHTWLPLAHVQAPTAGSVILAGVLLKMGTYGFIRFALPLFPQATLSFIPTLAILGVIGIIYGALVSMVQKDMKSLVAYSSISHLGFCMLGLAALDEKAVLGSVYQGLNHGVSTGALFLLVGVIYERRHTREISEYGGIAARVPLYTVVFIITALSSIGLPGLNGFVGEFLILIGTFSSNAFAATSLKANAGPWLALVASSGVILAAVYLLWLVKRVFFGPLKNPANQDLQDLNARERIIFAPLLALMLFMGVAPGWFFERMAPTVSSVVAHVRRHAQLPPATVSTATPWPVGASPVVPTRAEDVIRRLPRLPGHPMLPNPAMPPAPTPAPQPEP